MTDHVSPARFSSLETKVENLETLMTGLDSKLNSIATSLHLKGQWDWRSIFAGVAILLMLIGAFFSAAITPIIYMVRYGETERHSLRSSLKDLEDDQRQDSLSLRIIETKLSWQNDVMNMLSWQLRQQSALLWKKSFGENIPQIPYIDVGPGRTTTVRDTDDK